MQVTIQVAFINLYAVSSFQVVLFNINHFQTDLIDP